MGKEEIACIKQFLLVPQCFLFNQVIVSLFVLIFDIVSLFAAEMEEHKIGISGNDLTRPNDKILDQSKLKEFADDKVNVTLKIKFVLGRVENIVGKRRKCWLPAFSPFATMFSKGFLYRVIKS